MKGHKWAYFGSLIILMQVNNVRLLILLLKDAFIVDVLKVISLILSTSYIFLCTNCKRGKVQHWVDFLQLRDIYLECLFVQ